MRLVWWFLWELFSAFVLLSGLCFLAYGGIFVLNRPPGDQPSYGLESLDLFVLLPIGICFTGFAIWPFWALVDRKQH